MLFERWWNWKASEVQDMWRGTVRFWVLQEVPYKGEIQLHDAGGEPCIYIKQITTKRYVHCILLYLKLNI
jgi:hypothetical protein